MSGEGDRSSSENFVGTESIVGTTSGAYRDGLSHRCLISTRPEVNCSCPQEGSKVWFGGTWLHLPNDGEMICNSPIIEKETNYNKTPKITVHQ